MATLGNILIADDEETFLQSTADLLRSKGYYCACAFDAKSASNLIRQNRYDVLISDIRMPGNLELEFVKNIPEISYGLPTIIVTGYPSLKSAIMSVRLPVLGYLIKPIELDELLALVKIAVEQSMINQIALKTQERLKEWNIELRKVTNVLSENTNNLSPLPLDVYLGLSISNIALCLNDIKNVAESSARLNNVNEVCQLLSCPRSASLVSAIKETINTLEDTKRSFKSKELGELRRKLEAIIENI
jgi:DNA-binding response OmpR family regulator